jgi:hypothetical protein
MTEFVGGNAAGIATNWQTQPIAVTKLLYTDKPLPVWGLFRLE